MGPFITGWAKGGDINYQRVLCSDEDTKSLPKQIMKIYWLPIAKQRSVRKTKHILICTRIIFYMIHFIRLLEDTRYNVAARQSIHCN